MKLIITATLIAATSLFSTVAYGDTIKPAIVNVDGLSDSCVLSTVVENVVLICPKKDKELLSTLVNANKETHND